MNISGVGSDGGGGVSTPRSSSSDNYRRDFAQGALPHSLVSSDSEISQPNTRPTSRNHRSRYIIKIAFSLFIMLFLLQYYM